MQNSIDIRYRFLSTGNLDFQKLQDSDLNTSQRVFSRLIGSLKQIKLHSTYVTGCIIDFRLINNPSEKAKHKETLKCLFTFSFKLAKGINKKELANMHDDLKKYCESLLTLKLRQQNFTI